MPLPKKKPTPNSDDDDLDYPWQEAIRFVRKIRDAIGKGPRTSEGTDYGFSIRLSDYIGFVPSPSKVVRRMIELAEIKRGETVYDLGCGDGRILVRAVRKHQARGVGIDIDPEKLARARKRARRFLDRITFQQGSVFDADLRRADVVTIYLIPKLNKKLMPQLAKLKRGARVITHAFELPGVTPSRTARLTCKDGLNHNLFVYRVPFERRK